MILLRIGEKATKPVTTVQDWTRHWNFFSSRVHGDKI